MTRAALAWDVLLVAFAGAFTQPSFALFRERAGAWVVCAGRHTVTRLLRVMHPAGRRAHDAYHRFLRAGAWSMAGLWKAGGTALAQGLCPAGVVALDLDETLFHKAGRQIEGAGIFRDAVRSRPRSVVYALGLNLVVLTLRVHPPWGGEPLRLPINVRLYRKGGPSHVELGEEMIREIAEWLPAASPWPATGPTRRWPARLCRAPTSPPACGETRHGRSRRPRGGGASAVGRARRAGGCRPRRRWPGRAARGGSGPWWTNAAGRWSGCCCAARAVVRGLPRPAGLARDRARPSRAAAR